MKQQKTPLNSEIRKCLALMDNYADKMENLMCNWIRLEAGLRKAMMDQRKILSEKEGTTNFFQGNVLKDMKISHLKGVVEVVD